VKLSDVAALKRRLGEEAKEAKEAKKQKLISKLGEEGYKKKVADDAAAAEKKRKREEATKGLKKSLEQAIAASGSGIETTLVGMTISKTAAIKSEWYVKPDELERHCTPIDPKKKIAKYHLSDVIGVAHNKTPHYRRLRYSDRNTQDCRKRFRTVATQHISVRIKGFPAREKAYARYLLDKFEEYRTTVDDETIVQSACNEVKGKVSAAVKKAREELTAEETRLAALDGLVNVKGGGSKKGARKSPPEESVDENAENGSKKPAAKKQKKTSASIV